MKALEDLGHFVARKLGEGPGDARVQAQRQQFLARVLGDGSRRSRGRPLLWLGGGAAVAALSVVAVLAVTRTGDELKYWVGPEGRHAPVGLALVAPSDSDLLVRFEEGTQVHLEARASGRVLSAHKSHVVVALDKGRLRADVHAQAGRRWRFAAGPYAVEVLGTSLSVEWRPDVARLRVAVVHGVVRVTGGQLASEGVELRTGQHLEIGPQGGAIALPADKPVAALVAPGPREAKRARPSSAPPSDNWMQLATTGRHAEALALARQLGLDRLARTLGLTELAQLADTARYAGASAEARSLLTALERRFGRSPQGRLVPFLLGRVALELDRDPREAARWFAKYAGREPRGPLVEEALGRRMVALREAGDGGAAQEAAAAYLHKYPTGSFSALAQSLVEGKTTK